MRFAVLLAALFLSGSSLASAQTAVPAQQFAELGTCKLESGATIENCRLGYRTFGKLNPAKTNAVLVPLWSAGHSADLAAQIGPGKLIDDTQYFIVTIDPFGNGVSSSPSNSGTQAGVSFPEFTIRDMVEAEHRLAVETLGLEHVRAVVGTSMGGMQTFEWAVDYPTFMSLAVPIVATPQPSSYDLMLWSTERAALLADPDYNGGHYTRRPALPLVGAIHDMHLTTPAFRAEHVSREQFPGYWDHVAREELIGMDANDYLWQLEAMMSHDIAHGESLFAAAKRIQAHMLIVNAQQDMMVSSLPPFGFAKLLGAPTLVLEGDCGHSAPGCELGKLAPVMASFLASR